MNTSKITSKEISTLVTDIQNVYLLVQWPDSQDYMEKDWFQEEAIPDIEGKFGNSAYFIPLKRII